MPIQTKDITTPMSDVRIKLLDPLGQGIEGLKYQINKGARIVAKGVTDGQGKIAPFASELNVPLTLYVKRFGSDEMKMIKTFIPWSEFFPVKLLSSKVKELMKLVEDEGAPGKYKRKTYVVKPGDTLESVAQANGTSVGTLATLNGIAADSAISAGQVLKLPPKDEDSAKENPESKGPDATPSQTGATDSGTADAAPAETDGTTSGHTAQPKQEAMPAQDDQPNTAPATTTKSEDRGKNGSPKTTVELTCDQKACIKLGDKGPLVEEINIRLMGFGGTVAAPAPLNEFTAQTEKAVKQFQRDYMQITETGRVCGVVLRALDDFMQKYPASLASMKCQCGKCDGFGHGYQDSGAVDLYKPEKMPAKSGPPAPDTKPAKIPYQGIERPGIHRSIFWVMRAALFYAHDKDKELGYKFIKISSGFRCWHRNKQLGLKSHNHMGDALDIQFTKDSAKTRCDGKDVDDLRKKVFMDRLGGQLGWDKPATNEAFRLSLEPGDTTNAEGKVVKGASSWVHADVRNFLPAYKNPRYYAVAQPYADGDPMVEMAKREGRLSLIACGGIPLKAPPPEPTDRLPIASLTISRAGVQFIKDWEKCGLTPYPDSEGYCTIGWGHLIDDKRSCEDLERVKSTKYAKFKNGITQEEADYMLIEDVTQKTAVVNQRVQVPMYQHEYDALVSLIYNLGSFKKCPNLLAKLNTKDYSGCCDEFADITNGGIKGLVDRRKAEMKMFRNNVYDSSH